MNAKMIKEILQRAQAWPESAQADWAQAALEIERELQQDTYTATPEEVEAIERGLRQIPPRMKAVLYPKRSF